MTPDCGYERGDVAAPAPTHIVSRNLSQLHWLRHASTCRTFDTRGLPRSEELAKLLSLLSLPPMPVAHAQQRHTANVGVISPEILVDARRDGEVVFPATDALVCTQTGIMLAVFTADCVPVLIADTATHAVAIAHAGWRGTLGRITEATVCALQRRGSSPADLRVWIGPAIGGCCYEVSEELAGEFSSQFDDASTQGLTFRSGRLLDLGLINAYQAHRTGIPWQSISTCGLCTRHNRERFFSYRGDGPATGRIISCITALENGASMVRA